MSSMRFSLKSLTTRSPQTTSGWLLISFFLTDPPIQNGCLEGKEFFFVDLWPVNPYLLRRLKRQGDGSFRDEDLAKILHDATEDPAGAFRARGTPGTTTVLLYLSSCSLSP
jgi:hypothetical protein